MKRTGFQSDFSFPQPEHYVLTVSTLTRYSSVKVVQRKSDDDKNECIRKRNFWISQ